MTRQLLTPPKVQLRANREWAVVRGDHEVRRFHITDLQAAMTFARGLNYQGTLS